MLIQVSQGILDEARFAFFAAKRHLLFATVRKQLVAVFDSFERLTDSRNLIIGRVVTVDEVFFVLLSHQVEINHLFGFFNDKCLMLVSPQNSVVLLLNVFNLVPELGYFLLALLYRVRQKPKR